MNIYYQIRQKCKSSASHELNSEWKEKYIFVLEQNDKPVCLVEMRLLRIRCENIQFGTTLHEHPLRL